MSDKIKFSAGMAPGDPFFAARTSAMVRTGNKFGTKLIDTTPTTRAIADITFPFSLPLARGPRQVDSGFTNYFEALTPTLDRTPIPLYIYAIRSVLQTFNRVQLAFLARYLYDNDGLTSLAVNTIADYCAPVTPYSTVKDQIIAEEHNEFFEDWKKTADFSGRFGFDMLMRLICKAIDVDGDILLTMTSENGFPQVQLLETWRVDSRAVQKTELHVDGVAVTPKQQVIGYWVVNQLNNFMVGVTPPEFVSANNAVLLYDPDRFSSFRGMSPIRRGCNDIRDAKDIKAFEKMATKVHSALAAVIEGGVIEEDVWGNDTGENGTEVADDPDGPMQGNKPPPDATQQEQKLSIAELLGGDIPVLPNGQKLNLLQNSRAAADTVDFISTLGGFMVAGLGLPPSFVIQGGHTGPGERSVNGKAQRKFNGRIQLLGDAAEWIYTRVIADGIDKKLIPPAPRWYKPKVQGPPKVSIDDGRDADSWRQDFANGLMTRQNHFGNRALNWREETDQGFVEDDYILTKAQQLSEKTKVPVELILARWGYTQAKPPGPEKPEEDEGNEGAGNANNNEGKKNPPNNSQNNPPKKS